MGAAHLGKWRGALATQGALALSSCTKVCTEALVSLHGCAAKRPLKPTRVLEAAVECGEQYSGASGGAQISSDIVSPYAVTFSLAII